MTRRRRWLLTHAALPGAWLFIAAAQTVAGDWLLAATFAFGAVAFAGQEKASYHLFRAGYWAGARDMIASVTVGEDLVQRDPHPAEILGDRHAR